MARVSNIEAELNHLFFGNPHRGKRKPTPAPVERWGFQYGDHGTRVHEAPWVGPFPTRAAAEAARDEWTRQNDRNEWDSPYAWVIERMPPEVG